MWLVHVAEGVDFAGFHVVGVQLLRLVSVRLPLGGRCGARALAADGDSARPCRLNHQAHSRRRARLSGLPLRSMAGSVAWLEAALMGRLLEEAAPVCDPRAVVCSLVRLYSSKGFVSVTH